MITIREISESFWSKKMMRILLLTLSFCYTVATAQQSTYKGSNNIPCIIEAENYDTGGEGVSYHDVNKGEADKVANYRTGEDAGVEIEPKANKSNGHIVGWTSDGEWLEYTFNAKDKGSYTISIMATARNVGSKGFQLFIDEKKISSRIEVNPKAGWFSEWKEYKVNTKIKKGKHVLRLEIFSDDKYAINIDYIEFVSKKEPAQKQFSVTNFIRDNSVLQRNSNVNIWGKGKPGSIVTIEPEWGIAATALVNNNGDWKTKVATKEAGGPYKLVIKDENQTLTFSNILLGEVWVASGQSNMELPLKGWGAGGSVNNAATEIAKANFSKIRIFQVERNASFDPKYEANGIWRICNPTNANNFSAVAYFFARELYNKLNVPIGIIQATKGSSKAEAWTSTDELKKVVGFENIERDLTRSKTKNKPYTLDYINDDTKQFETPAALFNGMISPIKSYTIKGVIWYQGESNSDNPKLYSSIFPALIQSWRKAFKSEELPFYYAQITPFQNYDNNKHNSYEVREVQFMGKDIRNTGMAVTLDLGDRWKIHPGNKQDVGKRLALWALAKQYNFNELVYSGPIYKSAEFENGEGKLKFNNIGDGLKLSKGPNNFEISGIDGVFHKADVAINNDVLEVSSNEVTDPTQVRYGWSNWVVPTLYNMDGLPASSFRTYTAFVFSEKYKIDQGAKVIKVPLGQENITIDKFLSNLSTIKGATCKVVDVNGKTPTGKMSSQYRVLSIMNNGQDSRYYNVMLGALTNLSDRRPVASDAPTRSVAKIQAITTTQVIEEESKDLDIANRENISIRALSNNLYVSSENGLRPITCNRTKVDIWERFSIESVGGGRVAIKGNNGSYFSSEDGLKPMRCNRKKAEAWEEFTLEPLGGDLYAIKGNNGAYVSHNNGSVEGLTCNKSIVGDQEKFIIKDAASK